MPDIFTYWDSDEHAHPHQADLVRLWERSWAARGWRPRILTVRNAAKHRLFKRTHPDSYPELALLSAGGGIYAASHEINFDFWPKDCAKPVKRAIGKIRGTTYLSQGWDKAKVVDFENCHPDEIANCGRRI